MKLLQKFDTTFFLKHSVYFGRVCMYVCLSDDNFWRPWHRKFIFALPGYTGPVRIWRSSNQGQGHGSKKVTNASSCSDQIWSAIFIGTRRPLL